MSARGTKRTIILLNLRSASDPKRTERADIAACARATVYNFIPLVKTPLDILEE